MALMLDWQLAQSRCRTHTHVSYHFLLDEQNAFCFYFVNKVVWNWNKSPIVDTFIGMIGSTYRRAHARSHAATAQSERRVARIKYIFGGRDFVKAAAASENGWKSVFSYFHSRYSFLFSSHFSIGFHNPRETQRLSSKWFLVISSFFFLANQLRFASSSLVPRSVSHSRWK